ncbi:MAG: phycobiliprotein lyase [Cyanobacteria bacterium J06621_12]
MNPEKFLSQSAGRWFSQRTNYFLDRNQSASSKADLTIEFLSGDDTRVTELCQKHDLDSGLAIGGMVQSWDNSVDWGKDKQVGSATIVLVKDADSDNTGKLIRPQDSKVCGHYVLGEDEALTLTINQEEMEASERQWFASDNFKMRTTIVKLKDGTEQTSFYSEIRKAPPSSEQ